MIPHPMPCVKHRQMNVEEKLTLLFRERIVLVASGFFKHGLKSQY